MAETVPVVAGPPRTPSRPLHFDILTIFPGFFSSIFSVGVLSRALRERLVSATPIDLRDFTHDRHRTVDDRPFGGGEGMVLKPEPIGEALAALGIPAKAERDLSDSSVILLSAQGPRLTQADVRRLATLRHVVLICGRYEGVDERVNQLFCDAELSIGDYVLSGGELAAAVVLDSTVRLLPGVLGNADSAHYESFGTGVSSGPAIDGTPAAVSPAGGLLDYPHYTRPVEFAGQRVPETLLKGDHGEIRRWRRQQALIKTLQNRPDLLESATLQPEDLTVLDRLRRGSTQP